MGAGAGAFCGTAQTLSGDQKRKQMGGSLRCHTLWLSERGGGRRLPRPCIWYRKTEWMGGGQRGPGAEVVAGGGAGSLECRQTVQGQRAGALQRGLRVSQRAVGRGRAGPVGQASQGQSTEDNPPGGVYSDTGKRKMFTTEIDFILSRTLTLALLYRKRNKMN